MDTARDISTQILEWLPYGPEFCFVDEIVELSEDRVVGYHRFREDAFFYRGHFKNYPVTPGVILTECMAQLGVVCLGLYLMREQIKAGAMPGVAMASQSVDYYQAVYPGERVRVEAGREYFRFGKLKCRVAMYNEQEKLVCRGTLSGMTKQL